MLSEEVKEQLYNFRREKQIFWSSLGMVYPKLDNFPSDISALAFMSEAQYQRKKK